MDEQIMNVIVELVKEGGQIAVWVYLLTCLTTVLKYAIGFGVSFGIIAYIAKKIINAVREFNKS